MGFFAFLLMSLGLLSHEVIVCFVWYCALWPNIFTLVLSVQMQLLRKSLQTMPCCHLVFRENKHCFLIVLLLTLTSNMLTESCSNFSKHFMVWLWGYFKLLENGLITLPRLIGSNSCFSKITVFLLWHDWMLQTTSAIIEVSHLLWIS